MAQLLLTIHFGNYQDIDRGENTMIASHEAHIMGPKLELVAGSLELTVRVGEPLRDVEKLLILSTLRLKNFNRTHAAKALGIGIRTLQRKIKQSRDEGGALIA